MDLKAKKKLDFKLLICVLALVSFGIVMIYSASFYSSLVHFGDMYKFLNKEVIFASLGIFLMFIAYKFPYRLLGGNMSKLLFAVGIVLLILVLIVGTEVNGGRRWLDLGFINFMPSEFMRLASVILFAHMLSLKENLNSLKNDVMIFLAIIGIISLLIIKQPNMSTMVLIGLTLMSMLFVGGLRKAHITLFLMGTTPVLLGMMLFSEYRRDRVFSFLDPFKDANGDGMQVVNSLYAFGKGSLFGVGLGKGSMNKLFIPEPQNDFIFSTVGEEFGFIGSVTVVFLFVYLIYRGYKIALSCKDRFGFYLAFGITTSVALQFIVNIAVTLSLVPPTGIPLPFISYGGTHLIMLLISMGILLNISRSNPQGESS